MEGSWRHKGVAFHIFHKIMHSDLGHAKILNSSPSGQYGRHFPEDIFKGIFMNDNFAFWFEFQWSLFLRVQLTIICHCPEGSFIPVIHTIVKLSMHWYNYIWLTLCHLLQLHMTGLSHSILYYPVPIFKVMAISWEPWTRLAMQLCTHWRWVLIVSYYIYIWCI